LFLPLPWIRLPLDFSFEGDPLGESLVLAFPVGVTVCLMPMVLQGVSFDEKRVKTEL